MMQANTTNSLLENIRGLKWEKHPPQAIYRWAKANIPDGHDPVIDAYLKEICPWWEWDLPDWTDVMSTGSEFVLDLQDVRRRYKVYPNPTFNENAWGIGPDDGQKISKPYRLMVFPLVGIHHSFYWAPGSCIWLGDSWSWYQDLFQDGEWVKEIRPELLTKFVILDRASNHQIAYDFMHDQDDIIRSIGERLWETRCLKSSSQ